MIGMINLEQMILQWAEDRGILQNSNPITQFGKLVSEVGELADNIVKGRDVEDDIGDCIVVLSIIASMKGTTLTKCTNRAWNDIKDRKGYLNSDGVFIKDTDCGSQLLFDFDKERI